MENMTQLFTLEVLYELAAVGCTVEIGNGKLQNVHPEDDAYASGSCEVIDTKKKH